MSQTSFLAALCLILSSLEYAIPKPFPFLRLGLANLPIILSIRKFSVKDILFLALLKVLVQALVSGTLFSYVLVFSLVGTFASVLVMILLAKLMPNAFSDFGLTVAGSLANNAAQLVCSRFILFGSSVTYVAPLLLCFGLITGCALGAFVLAFENRSEWYKRLSPQTLPSLYEVSSLTGDEKGLPRKDRIFFVLCIGLLVLFLLVRNLYVQWSLVLIFFIMACVRKQKPVKVLPSTLVTLSVVILSLLRPEGKVLFYLGSWRITLGSLCSGLERSGILVGMTFLSQAVIGSIKMLPGKIGKTVSQVFYCASFLQNNKPSFVKGRVFENLDQWLLKIY